MGVPAQVLRLAWHTALSLLSHASRPGSEMFTKQNAMGLFLVYQSNDCYNPYGLIVYVHSSVMKMAPLQSLPYQYFAWREEWAAVVARFICVLERQ